MIFLPAVPAVASFFTDEKKGEDVLGEVPKSRLFVCDHASVAYVKK